MSLKKLQNLSNHDFSEHIIKQLQFWLQSQPKNTWLYLNPLQFAVDTRIPSEQAINLFLQCTLEEEGAQIFRLKSIFLCPNCDEYWGKVYDSLENDINLNSCCNCGLPINEIIKKESQNIYFELIIDIFPESSTYYPDAKTKVNPLTLDKFEEEGSPSLIERLQM